MTEVLLLSRQQSPSSGPTMLCEICSLSAAITNTNQLWPHLPPHPNNKNDKVCLVLDESKLMFVFSICLFAIRGEKGLVQYKVCPIFLLDLEVSFKENVVQYLSKFVEIMRRIEDQHYKGQIVHR